MGNSRHQAAFNKSQHDNGDKTVLGQTGNWSADDIVRICLEQKSVAPFLVHKLYRFLISETVVPSAELLEPLAEQVPLERLRLRRAGQDDAFVEPVLLRRWFIGRASNRRSISC